MSTVVGPELIECKPQCHNAMVTSSPSRPSSENFCLRPMRYNHSARIPWPSTYAAESTLHLHKPDYLLGPDRIIAHQAFLTHSGSVHDNKFYQEERDFQPKHPLAPSNTLVKYIRPDFYRKMEGVVSRNMKAYNPFPNRLSETKANFTPHYPEASMFGQAGIFITDHFVHMPANRVNVVPAFSYDDMFSTLRKAHPYMTTYRIYHKNFQDELPQHKFLDSLYNLKIGPSVPKSQNNDCAVKLLVRPMLDPFEQTLVKEGTLPSLDLKRENPGETRNFAHLKQFFRRPPYAGCPPRVHQPVPHMGMNTTYQDTYDRPLHPNMALNHCQDERFCYVQPPLSLSGLHHVPEVYYTENTIYGSGRNVASYVDNDPRDPMCKGKEIRDEAAFAAELLKSSPPPSGCRRGAGSGCPFPS